MFHPVNSELATPEPSPLPPTPPVTTTPEAGATNRPTWPSSKSGGGRRRDERCLLHVGRHG
jgi:hypothetical protein